MRGMFFGACGLGSAIYRGAACNIGECAIGRLVFASSVDMGEYRSEAQILVADTAHGTHGLFEELASLTVGIVITGERPSARVLYAAEQLGIPVLSLDALPKRHHGRLAILDTKSSALFVDPDIETLDRYSGSFGSFGDMYGKLSLNLSQLQLVRNGTASEISGVIHLCSAGRRGEIRSEDELFDDYRDICENVRPLPLTLMLSPAHPLTAGSKERFLTHLRAIFRAAVYGDIRILCTGPCTLTVDGAQKCHSVFCEAREQFKKSGHEQNTGVPIGLLIASPLLFFRLGALKDFDLLYLDLERLSRHMLGISVHSPITQNGFDEVCSLIKKELSKSLACNKGGQRISIMLGKELSEHFSTSKCFELIADEVLVEVKNKINACR